MEPRAVPKYSIDVLSESSNGALAGEAAASRACWGAIMPKPAIPQTSSADTTATKLPLVNGTAICASEKTANCIVRVRAGPKRSVAYPPISVPTTPDTPTASKVNETCPKVMDPKA